MVYRHRSYVISKVGRLVILDVGAVGLNRSI